MSSGRVGHKVFGARPKVAATWGKYHVQHQPWLEVGGTARFGALRASNKVREATMYKSGIIYNGRPFPQTFPYPGKPYEYLLFCFGFYHATKRRLYTVLF